MNPTFIELAKMQCPFLSRLPGSFIKNYAVPLLKNYADQCPVISRAVSVNKGPHYHQEFAAAFKNAGTDPDSASSRKPYVKDISMKCPFLNDLGKDGTKQLIKLINRILNSLSHIHLSRI